MNDPIKSKDLCARCKYSFSKWCQGVQGGDCNHCEHGYEDGKCACLTVKINTPCPYFKEVKDDETTN